MLCAFVRCCVFMLFLSLLPLAGQAQELKTAPPITKGERVYSIGHSFHVFMPGILNALVKETELKDHKQVGMSAIGGSRVIQHWDVADDKFKAKALLKAGEVDVLTIAPIFLPDEGIEKFASLAVEHNPNIRITIQEFWLPHDWYEPPNFRRQETVDRNTVSIEELRKRHAPYFESIDQHVRDLNKKFGKQALFVAPVGQAVLELREKIVAGKAPGLTKQTDLFTDAIGHATPPLQALVAYVHYAVTYRRSPVGLAAPPGLQKPPADPALVKLLQEIAWQAAVAHPLSGVAAK